MKKISLIIGLLLLVPASLDAASVHVSAPPSVNVGSEFTAEVFLDTEGENINAIEGSLVLPAGISVAEIRYQGSVVSLWLTAPQVRTQGVVDFAGVMPAGYQGSPERTGARGNLFTVLLRAENEGGVRLAFGDSLNAYRNDGEGTLIPLSKSFTDVVVVSSGAPESVGVGVDVYPPEVFVPEIVSGGLYGMEGDVLVFSTQDKDSGMRGYDVGFSYIGFLPEFLVSWFQAESPYVLADSASGKYLFVRAVDMEGNTRVAVVSPQEPGFASFFMTWGLPAAVLLFVAFLFFAIFLAKRTVSLK